MPRYRRILRRVVDWTKSGRATIFGGKGATVNYGDHMILIYYFLALNIGVDYFNVKTLFLVDSYPKRLSMYNPVAGIDWGCSRRRRRTKEGSLFRNPFFTESATRILAHRHYHVCRFCVFDV